MNEPLTPDEFDDLLGAFALDALDADEIAAVDAYVLANPAAGREVERLRSAAVWYGASVASSPPPALRTSLLDRARAARAPELREEPGTAAHLEADAYLHEVLRTVATSDLDQVTSNGLSIRNLIAHLAVMESAVTDGAGNPKLAEIRDLDVAARTANGLSVMADWNFAAVVSEWERAATVSRSASQTQPELHWFGAMQGAQETLAYRAFETWIHAGDIAEAIGGGRRPLSDIGFSMMATVSMSLLAGCMAKRGVARDGATARIVLTGEGGGEWIAPIGRASKNGGAPIVTITAPIHEWCLRVGDRIDPDLMPVQFDGDEQAGRDLVGAANAFAML